MLGGSFTYLREKNASAIGEQARWDVRRKSVKQQKEETPLKPTKWVVNRAPSSPQGIQSRIIREYRNI